MLGLLLVTSALLGNDPAGPSPFAPEERDSYEAALAQVGRDADAHVRLALWCEAHGLNAERVKHLSLAVLNDPAHPMARGLLGLVAFRGHWRRPDAVGAALAADADRKALIADYEQRRDKLAETADAHWKLALWCEENGLKAESVAHLWSAVRLDPSREPAWRRLGYRKQKDGRWLTEAMVAREKEEAGLQKRADRHWKPLLEKWREMLAGKDPAKHAEAEAGLAGVTDPRAVPMVWAVFATGNEARQAVAVRVLGQIDAAGASRSLAFLALASGSAEVRRAATETLRRRDVREYAGLLIAMLRDPIKYEVRQVNGPGTSGSIFIEGKRVNVQRRYNAPPPPYLSKPPGPGDTLIYGLGGPPVMVRGGNLRGFVNIAPDGSFAMAGSGIMGLIPRQQDPAFVTQMIHDPGNAAQILAANVGKGVNSSSQQVRMRTTQLALQTLSRGFSGHNALGSSNTIMLGQAILETQKAAATAQQQLLNDVAALDRLNAQARETNERVAQILNNATEQNLPADAGTWQRWLTDQFGYAQRVSDRAKPTMVQDFTPELPPLAGFDSNQDGYMRIYSCFGAGTPVHTLTGIRPIEALRVGDEVLTQDLRTGALRYQPILVVHHNPPSKTFRIALGGETIVSSEFHRFWRAGQGWVMARDLKPGDTLRTLGGLARVEAVETGAVQPVFNLDVAEDADFFVGAGGALVHDNTLPDLRQAPFDAAPDLAAVAANRD